MRSNYKRIGDFIELIDERNKKLEVNTLVGLSISKEFIPSVANTIGTNMANYKIIRKNQFACSLMQVRRDKKIPVALLQKFDEAIISQAYPVFQIKDENELLPQYLMMWMSRSEFDRHACFLAVGGVRGSLEWDDFCDMELPIPSIDKQREIVKEYNTIVNRIKLNEQLNQKLEETAQALYKNWFVDFEFPNADGKPYKSSGGKMIYNAELDKEIPEGWKVLELSKVCSKITKGTTPQLMSESRTYATPISYIKGESINDSHSFDLSKISFIDNETNEELLRSQLKENDICYSIAGSLDKFTLVDKEILPGNTNQAIAIIRVDDEFVTYQYLYGYFVSQLQKEYYNFNIQQAVQANLSLATIGSLPLIVPSKTIAAKISFYMDIWVNNRNSLAFEQRRLLSFKDLLLSKMTKVKTKKEAI